MDKRQEFMQIYRQAKGLPQEEPEQTDGAQMKAAEQTADAENPSQSDSGNSYGTAPASLSLIHICSSYLKNRDGFVTTNSDTII